MLLVPLTAVCLHFCKVYNRPSFLMTNFKVSRRFCETFVYRLSGALNKYILVKKNIYIIPQNLLETLKFVKKKHGLVWGYIDATLVFPFPLFLFYAGVY